MRSAINLQWMSPGSARTALAIALIVLAVGIGGCQQAKDFMAKQSEEGEALAVQEEAAAEAERLAAEARALEEQSRLAAEEAALAEAEAKAAQEALEAAERELAEKEALLAQKEEQLRRQRALQEEKERLAARQAALEEQEQELFERERELEAREVNIAVAEDELRDRALAPGAGEDEESAESPGWSNDGWSQEDGPEPVSASVEEDLPAPEYSRTASLQPGKVIEVEILETLSSRTHRLGDTFSGRLVQDLRAEDGTLVVAAGAEVVGEITEVTPLKKVGGQASLGIEFTSIEVAPGESVAISASFLERGVDKSKDKKKIIGATIAGAILGRVLGGKGGENAAVGAVVGAAAGTAAVARSEGKDAEIPAGEMVALQLEEVVTVEVDMTGTVDRE
jgi:murein DD-endopeptidase MepM/ murein hydrolase activator NlpD